MFICCDDSALSNVCFFFFLNERPPTEFTTRPLVGGVRGVEETGLGRETANAESVANRVGAGGFPV